MLNLFIIIIIIIIIISTFQPVLHDWCNKDCGMCYPVCGMMHIKEPLLLIGRVAYVVAADFLSHYQSGLLPYVWPYNRK